MRSAFVGVVGALIAFATSLHVHNDLLSYAFAVLALVVGAVVWARGRAYRHDSRATALAVAGIGTVQLLAFPVHDGAERWRGERWQPDPSPWSATVDSALAARPAPEVPGAYALTYCFERCAAGDTTNAAFHIELKLLPVHSVVRSFPRRAFSPNGCVRDVERGRRSAFVRPIYWVQSRYGAVTWRDLERVGNEWRYDTGTEFEIPNTHVAVTEEGLVGVQKLGSAMMYVAGQRMEPADATECP